MPETAKRSLWTQIGTQLVSFVVGIIVAAFIFGRSAGDLRQKINDVTQWKTEVAPRIERIDRGGSISFDNFKTNYDAEQAKQYERLKVLETQIQHIQTIELRLNTLEKKAGLDP